MEQVNVGSRCVHNGRPATVARLCANGTADVHYTDHNVLYPVGERLWKDIREQHARAVVFTGNMQGYTHCVFKADGVPVQELNVGAPVPQGRMAVGNEARDPRETNTGGALFLFVWALLDRCTRSGSGSVSRIN